MKQDFIATFKLNLPVQQTQLVPPAGPSPELELELHMYMHAQSLQLCPTLSDPLDCSPQGSSVHGILQARTLEWVAMLSSRGSSQPRD